LSKWQILKSLNNSIVKEAPNLLCGRILLMASAAGFAEEGALIIEQRLIGSGQVLRRIWPRMPHSAAKDQLWSSEEKITPFENDYLHE
jgi:hypothetical protein